MNCGHDSYCVPIFIYGPRGEQYAGIALVDTGASHSLVPQSISEQLGLPVIGHRNVQTANGYVEMPEVVGEIQVADGEVMGAQFLETPTGDLVAVGYDIVQRTGILAPTRYI